MNWIEIIRLLILILKFLDGIKDKSERDKEEKAAIAAIFQIAKDRIVT